MKNFGILASRAGKIFADNSPTILAAIGVTGVITTAVLTGKASIKAALILANEEASRDPGGYGEKIELREQIQLTWKEYIPAASAGLVTIACVILANRIGMRRTAALAAAYNIAEKAATQYKDKVVEIIGAKKEEEIRDAVSADKIRDRVLGREPIHTGVGPDKYMDSWSGREFFSSRAAIERAINAVNHKINTEFYASLTFFYQELGLAPTAISDDIGWNVTKLLDAWISYSSDEDDRPIGILEYNTHPVRNYDKAT